MHERSPMGKFQIVGCLAQWFSLLFTRNDRLSHASIRELIVMCKKANGMVLQEATNHACVLLERSVTMGPLRSFGDQRPELSPVSYECHLTTRIGRQMTFSVISRYELNRSDPSEYMSYLHTILYTICTLTIRTICPTYFCLRSSFIASILGRSVTKKLWLGGRIQVRQTHISTPQIPISPRTSVTLLWKCWQI